MLIRYVHIRYVRVRVHYYIVAYIHIKEERTKSIEKAKPEQD